MKKIKVIKVSIAFVLFLLIIITSILYVGNIYSTCKGRIIIENNSDCIQALEELLYMNIPYKLTENGNNLYLDTSPDMAYILSAYLKKTECIYYDAYAVSQNLMFVLLTSLLCIIIYTAVFFKVKKRIKSIFFSLVTYTALGLYLILLKIYPCFISNIKNIYYLFKEISKCIEVYSTNTYIIASILTIAAIIFQTYILHNICRKTDI